MSKNSNLFYGIFMLVGGLFGTCGFLYLGYNFISFHVLIGVVLILNGLKYIKENIGGENKK